MTNPDGAFESLGHVTLKRIKKDCVGLRLIMYFKLRLNRNLFRLRNIKCFEELVSENCTLLIQIS